MQSLINYAADRVEDLNRAAGRASDETVKAGFLADRDKWQEFSDFVKTAKTLDQVNAKQQELGISMF